MFISYNCCQIIRNGLNFKGTINSQLAYKNYDYEALLKLKKNFKKFLSGKLYVIVMVADFLIKKNENDFAKLNNITNTNGVSK